MGFTDTRYLVSELERSIRLRTGRRVRDLAIDVCDERVTLRGQTSSFYIKQLAQHGVRDILPHMPLENTIEVEFKPEVVAGRVLA